MDPAFLPDAVRQILWGLAQAPGDGSLPCAGAGLGSHALGHTSIPHFRGLQLPGAWDPPGSAAPCDARPARSQKWLFKGLNVGC